MKLELQKGGAAAEIDWHAWGIAFHGAVLDDRGDAAVRLLAQNAANSVTLRYDPATFQVEIGNDRVNADSFREAIRPLMVQPLVLEATTLGFVEILLCCRALDDLRIPAFDI